MIAKALIGCECSGRVRDALRSIGIDAMSCDIKPCELGSQYHLRCDIMDAITCDDWDFIGLHPDCTAMAVSGNRWYGKGMPRHEERMAAINFTQSLWELAKKHCKYAYLENPVSVIFSELSEPVQYIQPWQHGHGETKKTGFARYNLPELTPSNIVEGREQKVWKMPPGPNRKANRSRTYQGVADAIAKQWGSMLLKKNEL